MTISIERKQKANRRWYEVSGDSRVANPDGTPMELPNCTGILNIINKPALVNWAASQEAKLYQEAITATVNYVIQGGNTVFDASTIAAKVKEIKASNRKGPMERGTEAHEQIEKFLKRSQDSAEPIGIVEANAQAFLTDYSIKVMGIEVMAYHPELKYGCTLDAWGLNLQGDVVVLDWKTGSGVYNEYALQVAANAEAIRESLVEHTSWTGLVPNLRGYVVKLLTDKAGYEAKQVNLKESWERFKAALELSKLSKAVWLDA